MNVHLDRIFPTPIWSADFDINNKELYDWCKELQKNDTNGRNKSNYGGWQSNDIDLEKYLNVKPVKDLFFAIMNMANQAIIDCNYKEEHKNVKIGNSWININSKDCYNSTHVHAGTTFSGVYYVKSSEQSGLIRFERNFYESFLINSYGKINDRSELNADGVYYSPVEGRILLFPSYIPHSVEKNKDDLERVSISFNVLYYGWEIPNVKV